MNEEIWRPVVGYEGLYEVSNLGEIRNVSSYWNRKEGHKLRPALSKYGYLRVILHGQGKKKNMSVHRVVASAFCDKREDKNMVNHINGIKTDNRAENLEWCDCSENMTHAYAHGLEVHCGKPVKCIETGKVYQYASQAAKELGLKNDDAISRVCRGEREKCLGMHFKYL